mmetsp:Transcript_20884/g.20631  ORF Transcript_20884/g.20631 Transcript_20884/m.20631 type:complete len:119 (+) Transcript_20884:44-400(+)
MSRSSCRKHRGGHSHHKVDRKPNAPSKSRRSEGEEYVAEEDSKRPRGDSMPECIPFSNAANADVRRVGRFEIEEFCCTTPCLNGGGAVHDIASFGDAPVVVYTIEADRNKEEEILSSD